MSIVNVIILAIVQGLAELLPVSSSAHVVVVEKLLGLDPSSPPMTLLLVALHTGTMFAVIVYFWRQWLKTYFSSVEAFKASALRVIVATVLTALVGETLIILIEKTLLRDVPHAQIEDLFGHLEFIAPALGAAGLLIVWSGMRERKRTVRSGTPVHTARDQEFTLKRAGIIGTVQGLCLPFRGLSRSGATISTGMILGIDKAQAEAFSFALAVVITPPVIGREVLRLIKAERADAAIDLSSVATLSAFGAAVAFIAGLVALKWLSKWLESGRWYLFGIYCLVASAAVAYLYSAGY